MATTTAAPRGRTSQFRTYSGAGLLIGAVMAATVVDVILAFLAGVSLGLVLGYWVLPAVVDALAVEEQRARRMRAHRHDG